MYRLTSLLVCLLDVWLLCPGAANTDKKCVFPVEWRGRYYQTGLGDVFIRENFITTKGTCIEQNNRDYFLFHNHDSQCYACLLIMRQHRNIIQYKESYCSSHANMSVACGQIRVETTLYTMVKEPAISGVKCPFQDAFNFTYNEMTSDFCSRMESYAKPCVSQTRYQLLFRHCSGSAQYHDKEFHLECLATWKDGSEMYLYGRLSGSGLVTKDDRYRCFKYHYYGNEVTMAMSADTSCRGLRSASDGPLLMKFSKDSLNSRLSTSCQFPDWLDGVTWRSLDGKHQYTLDAESETFSEVYRSTSGPVQRINEFRCSQDFDGSPFSEDVIIVSFTSHKCPWIEVSGSYDRCRSHTYEDGQLLIPEGQTPSPCPRAGIYHVTLSHDTCLRRLEIGCHGNNTIIDLHDRCHNTQSASSLECLLSWNHDSKTNVIVRMNDTGSVNCFSFSRDFTGAEWFGLDGSCGRNQSITAGLWEKPVKLQRHEPCKDKDKSTMRVIEQDHQRTNRHPVSVSTSSPYKELNLYADGVQPRRRSTLPPDEFDDDDDDDIFSGIGERREGGSQGVRDRSPYREPPDRLPVTWKRAFPPVSTPLTVFHISSSPRRVNSAKFGAKDGSSNRGRVVDEGHVDRPQRGQGKVNLDDVENCSTVHRFPSMFALLGLIVYSGLTLCN